ncbi:ABC transporter substrate-binding protein [Rhodococcus sp. 1.20]
MPAQSTLLLPEGYSDNRLVSDLTRRQFGFGAGIAGLGAFLAACGDSGSSSGETEMRSVTTPLGTYDIPVNPKRVVAIDSRLDLEPAVALELPLVGYTYAQATPWVPIDSSVPFLSEIPNREQILALEPDLIVCLNYESEWWPVAEMSTIAPVLTTEFTDDWRTNLSRLSGWLGRTATLDRLTLDYDNLISDIRSRHAEKIASKTVASVSFMPDTNTLYVTSIRTSEKGDKPSDMTLGDIGGKTATSEGARSRGRGQPRGPRRAGRRRRLHDHRERGQCRVPGIGGEQAVAATPGSAGGQRHQSGWLYVLRFDLHDFVRGTGLGCPVQQDQLKPLPTGPMSFGSAGGLIR